MVTQQLIDYINKQLQNGVSRDQLKNTKILDGWDKKDVEEALNQSSSANGNIFRVSQNKPFLRIPVLILIGALVLILVGGSIYTYNVLFKDNRTPTTQPQPKPSQQPTSLVKTGGSVQFSLPKAPYSLVINGEIKKGYSDVELKPFFFVTSITNSLEKTESPPEAQFKIVLKKNNVVFYEDNFDATECIDFSPGDYCGKKDHSYGYFIHFLDGLSELPDEIVIQHLGKDIYTVKERIEPFPTLTLVSQELTNGLIKISWEVKGKSEKLNYHAYVSNNNFQVNDDRSSTAETISLHENNANDGGSKIFSGNSFTFSPKGYIEGELQVAIYVTDGFKTYVAQSNKFTTEKNQVEAKIRLPEDGKTYQQSYVPLEADSSDPRRGLSCGGCPDEGNTFTWTSSLDGVISNNHSTYCQFLTPGDHKITLQVKNQNGTEATTAVNLKISFVDIFSETETKARQQKGETCY